MMRFASPRLLLALSLVCEMAGVRLAMADGNIKKVNHIVVIMQENHSFDNYFGALSYAPGSPYHNGNGVCSKTDHACVDGLTACATDSTGNLTCSNSNFDQTGALINSFHDTRRCVLPDLDHSWVYTHFELNFLNPNQGMKGTSDGFVRVNHLTEQPTEVQTMNFYDQNEIPFYYDLAQKFAIDDRYFSSVLGPTFPNRSYFMAGTSFGHLTTNDTFPPPGGYKPINGTIFDLLNQNGVTWADYFQDAPQGGSFLPFSATSIDPHFIPLNFFFAQAAAGALPQVSFVDPNFGLTGTTSENDEHPPTDIQRGQAYVSQVLNAIRNSPNWPDTVVFITYDEHGGSYDHVRPPAAAQGGKTPDGISPGQCADLSNPPTSLQPGAGAECSANPFSTTDTSVKDAELLCPALALNPTGPYPAQCANFNQLGIRVPLLAISPFSKPSYVSHTNGDHTSLLAFIEARFLTPVMGQPRLHLTGRDMHASPLLDMFDFNHSPSLNTVLTQAAPPVDDCTP
jgi:phospholipase C